MLMHSLTHARTHAHPPTHAGMQAHRHAFSLSYACLYFFHLLFILVRCLFTYWIYTTRHIFNQLSDHCPRPFILFGRQSIKNINLCLSYMILYGKKAFCWLEYLITHTLAHSVFCFLLIHPVFTERQYCTRYVAEFLMIWTLYFISMWSIESE